MVNLKIPASKSISNRLLILQEVCRNKINHSFTIANLSTADDTVLLYNLLHHIKHRDAINCVSTTINCENCGTAYRFLTAFLACPSGKWILDGSQRMYERPIEALVETLQNAGADISYVKKNGFPPLAINGKSLNVNLLKINSSQSSQYVSALAMILPLIKKDVTLQFSAHTASLQYIDMTITLMQQIGFSINRTGNIITYHDKGLRIKDKENIFSPTLNSLFFKVESDWSAAAVWFVLSAFMPQKKLFIEGLQKSELQADSIIVDWVKSFGVKTSYLKDGVLLQKTTSKIPVEFAMDCGNNLDLVPYLAVLCAGLGVKGILKSIKNLAYKECNRSEILQIELSKIASVTVENDTLIIESSNKQMPDFVLFSSHGDHRIAMSLSILSACIPKVQIDDMDCVTKSYPDFSTQLAKFHFGNIKSR